MFQQMAKQDRTGGHEFFGLDGSIRNTEVPVFKRQSRFLFDLFCLLVVDRCRQLHQRCSSNSDECISHVVHVANFIHSK